MKLCQCSESPRDKDDCIFLGSGQQTYNEWVIYLWKCWYALPFLSFDRRNFAQIPSLPKFSDWRLSLPLWLGEGTGNELVHFYQGENCSQVFLVFTSLSKNRNKLFMKIRWLTITEALKVQIWKRLTTAVQKRWCQFSMKVNIVSFKVNRSKQPWQVFWVSSEMPAYQINWYYVNIICLKILLYKYRKFPVLLENTLTFL